MSINELQSDSDMLLAAIKVLRNNYPLISDSKRVIASAQRRADSLEAQLSETAEALGEIMRACQDVFLPSNDQRATELYLAALKEVLEQYAYLRPW